MAALKDVCPFLLFICTALQECSHGRSRHRGGQEAGGGTRQLHMTQHMTPSQAGARRLTLPVTCYLNNAAQGIEGTYPPRIQYAKLLRDLHNKTSRLQQATHRRQN